MKENKKALLKKTLIILSITLGIFWLSLVLYGMLIERPVSVNLEKSMGQIHIVDLSVPFDKKIIQEEKKQEELNSAIKELTKTEEPAKIQNPETKANPKIALIVTNLGTNKSLTEEALKLPKNISLGFSAYTSNLKNLYDEAVNSGKDVFIYLPFELKDYPINDPGLYAILSSTPSEKNIETIKSIISNFSGIKGVYAHHLESLSLKADAFDPILEFISEKKITLLLGRDISNDPSRSYDKLIGANLIIDDIADEKTINQNLNKLIDIAKTNGHAVGYLKTYPISIKLLSTWLSNISNAGVEIVPVSEIIIDAR